MEGIAKLNKILLSTLPVYAQSVFKSLPLSNYSIVGLICALVFLVAYVVTIPEREIKDMDENPPLRTSSSGSKAKPIPSRKRKNAKQVESDDSEEVKSDSPRKSEDTFGTETMGYGRKGNKKED